MFIVHYPILDPILVLAHEVAHEVELKQNAPAWETTQKNLQSFNSYPIVLQLLTINYYDFYNLQFTNVRISKI